jgi:hypothetical protein
LTRSRTRERNKRATGKARTEWLATPRFLRDYARASGPLQSLAEQEVKTLIRRAGSDRSWTASYAQVRGINGAKVLELELGGGPRLLAHVGDRTVTLVAMGDHEITRRYVRRGNLSADLKGSKDLPRQFRLGHRDQLLPAPGLAPPGRLSGFGNEISPDWIYFLDEEQAQVCDDLVDLVEDVLLQADMYRVLFVLGGPGTGKTSILLQVLKRLSDQVEPNVESWTVGLRVSDHLGRYIEASTGWDLTPSRQLGEEPADLDILLVDDPSSREEIQSFAQEARQERLRALVVAFDPLQLADSLSDAQYRNIVQTHSAIEWTLSTSYRQKKKVGKEALKVATVVAGSSPFLDEGKKQRYAKERRSLTNIANDLVFRNPSGYSASFPEATLSDWRKYLAWVSKQAGLWRHWPALLVVVDDDTSLPEDWRRALEDREGVRQLPLTDLEAIKGLEFQHVALILSRERYEAICDGFSGTGRRLYNDYRLLRIPFSRAKDSLAVFVRG